MTGKPFLIGDIGGTNARFALGNSERPGFTNEMTLNCADFASAEDAIRQYLDQSSSGPPGTVCLAVAGLVVDKAVRITNNNWFIRAEDLANALGADSARLINDFEAIAYAITHLGAGDCEIIGDLAAPSLAERDFTVAIVGPGTGFGAAGLIRRNGVLTPVVGEGGHVAFAPRTSEQCELLKLLQSQFDIVTLERLVSGPGLRNIHAAIAEIRGDALTHLSAGQIFAKSRDGSDPNAVAATRLFFELLGQFARDFALSFGAIDGVFLAGGITRRYPQMLKDSDFRGAFENDGRLSDLLKTIPTVLITHEEPGLLGAAYCAAEVSDSCSRSS
jgi:glucokinase